MRMFHDDPAVFGPRHDPRNRGAGRRSVTDFQLVNNRDICMNYPVDLIPPTAALWRGGSPGAPTGRWAATTCAARSWTGCSSAPRGRLTMGPFSSCSTATMTATRA